MLEAGHPVNVTCVHPGGIRTSIATSALAEARRLGLEVTPADEQRERIYNEKLLKMPPERAAGIILDGVAANRTRVLVGNDARVVDLLVRALPSAYPRVLGALTRRLLPPSGT
jgi:short-subunit dehydrogenase